MSNTIVPGELPHVGRRRVLGKRQYVHNLLRGGHLPGVRKSVRGLVLVGCLERISASKCRGVGSECFEIRVLKQIERSKLVHGLRVVRHRNALRDQDGWRLPQIDVLNIGLIGSQPDDCEIVVQ
jgi:hypothetical protein